MWRLKQFMPSKEAGGTLEGKHVDVGDLKLQVRSVIAQGGFSSVYLAKDSATGKTYALKHIICNDAESVELVKKEVSVMKALRGHPNVVTLHGQVVYDLGRTKECFLVMEYCHKMLAHVLENRGAGYYDEKQILLMFLDICNAVFAMHCQSPPVAHRDLKVENVLMGADGTWKLCDFGSTSINHKHFDTPEEMGLEEDCIRKFTTPSYRAPEMWDLYQKELISEKVDIWALGCLLYRIAYFKSAFDGESKLQILNCNYRIPDMPKYSSSVTGLIKDMLNVSPEARPDVMQVWQRVNAALPSDCRKSQPDKAPTHNKPLTSQKHHHTGASMDGSRVSSLTSSVSSRTPPKEAEPRSAETVGTNNSAKGAFWSTQYAQTAKSEEPALRQEKVGNNKATLPVKSTSPPLPSRYLNNSPPKNGSSPPRMGGVVEHRLEGVVVKVESGRQAPRYREHVDGEIEQHDLRQRTSYQNDDESGRSSSTSKQKYAVSEPAISTNDSSFAAFEAEYSQSVVQSKSHEHLKDEIDRLNEALKQALSEKSAIASKFEKLTTICRSQRQEIQDLKSALNSGTARNSSVQQQQQNSSSRARASQSFEQGADAQSGTIWDLQDGLSSNSANQQTSWAAFEEPPKQSNFTSSSQVNVRASMDSIFGSSGKTPDKSMRQLDVRSSNPGGESWKSASQERSPQVSSASHGNAKAFSSLASPNSSSLPQKPADSWAEPTSRVQPAGWAGF
ncbi:hypothetical protein M758_3G059700 [Ceratodon purpureus]|nr:hypothetical protein M758_3G059700 [Ceratodon purpureus]